MAILTPDDYRISLDKAINGQQTLPRLKTFDGCIDLVSSSPEIHQALFNETVSLGEGILLKPAELVLPFGSLNARIGIVLDWCPVDKKANEELVKDLITALPPTVRDCGFY